MKDRSLEELVVGEGLVLVLGFPVDFGEWDGVGFDDVEELAVDGAGA